MAKEELAKPVIIVGGGLVGSLLAIRLAQRGHNVEIFERRSDLRTAAKQEGRSINLAISVRGLHALKQVGLHTDALKIAIPMQGRLVHPLTGKTNLQPYSSDRSENIHSISRSGLNALLLDAAEKTGRVAIYFNRRIDSIDLENRRLKVTDLTQNSSSEISYRLLFGTDGSASRVRRAISDAHGVKESESVLDHGYKELILPAKAGDHQLTKNALHIWPRATFMLIALPNLDGSFTCTLFLPFDGERGFDSLQADDKVEQFFQDQFSDAAALIPNLAEEFKSHPTGQMVTVKTPRWSYRDEVCLLGDAAHAIVPFFGQGMNCGFEDVSHMMECWDPANLGQTFSIFEKDRKANTDAIADMAVENFVEMRDKVADPEFLRQKSLERTLQERFQGLYVNRYQLVTFTRLDYRLAYEIGEIEAKILFECHSLEEATVRVRRDVLPKLEEWKVKSLRGI